MTRRIAVSLAFAAAANLSAFASLPAKHLTPRAGTTTYPAPDATPPCNPFPGTGKGTAVEAQGAQSGHVVEVKALLSRDAVHPGETVKAAIVLQVQPGWHINNDAPDDPFMFGTSLTFAEDPLFEVVEILYPQGRRAKFSYSETELVVYEGQAVIGALLKVKDGAAPGPHPLAAALNYQACDNTSCKPPMELAFQVTVPVVAAGQPAKDINADVFAKLEFKKGK